MRYLSRLGRLEEKYEETEGQISALQGRLSERERDLYQAQRERADLKGALASTEGELRANKVEGEHEMRRLQEKVRPEGLVCRVLIPESRTDV